MPSLAWDDCCRPPPQRSRLLDRLRMPDWIDVKFLGPFNPHLVAKDTVNYGSSRVIRILRPITVVSVGLLPYRSIFQSNHRPAARSVEGTVHAPCKTTRPGVRLSTSCRYRFLVVGL